MNALFVYGTLRNPQVCRRLLGRMPASSGAILCGYVRMGVRGAAYPAMVADASNRVDGLVLTGLSGAELAALDAYEGDEYVRIEVCVETDAGQARVWAYVWAGSRERLCGRE